MLDRLRSALRTFLHRDRFEDGMRDELQMHVQLYTDDLIRSGLRPDEAARQARLAFGNIEGVKEDCRQARGLWIVDELRRDVRHASRRLRKSPGLAFTALATLALCLGANLTIFAVVDSILLRPLPFPTADRLVRAFNSYPKAGVPDDGTSITNYYERRGRIAAFSSLAAFRHGTAIIGAVGATAREPITQVSPDFFTTLGVAPAVGRTFDDGDMNDQAARVAIVADGFWRRELNADPHVIGRTVRVNGFEHAIVGVLPPTFRFLSSKSRLYFPLASSAEERGPDRRHSGSSSQMIARLRPGATLNEAQSQIDAHNAAVEAGDSKAVMMAEAGFHTPVVQLQADHVAAIRPALLLVQNGGLLLLLIAVVNLVNLLLVSASGRAREIAVRQALGASRQRVAIEVMIETAVLALVGAALGLVVAAAGIRLLPVLGAGLLPIGAEIVFDVRFAAAAFGAAVAIAVAAGTPVAWYAVRHQMAGSLQFESRGGTVHRAARRLRHSFVVAQTALALVLLSVAGLMAVSLAKAMTVSPGFQPDQVSTGFISLPSRGYPREASILAFSERLIDTLAEQPGIKAVGVATNVPLSGNSIKSAATAKGYVRRAGESPRGHYSYGVTGDYFTAMGLPLIEGRYLDGSDSRRTDRVCVVDDAFARHYWLGRSALGHEIFQGGTEDGNGEAFRIVGVVGAMKQADVTEDGSQGAVYYPLSHRLDRNLFAVVRTSVSPESFAGTLRAVVRQLDGELPVSDILPMPVRIADSLAGRRSPAFVVGLFSGLALVLTAIGTYGVLSYTVAQRRREIGLRMALGARPGQVRLQFFKLAGRLILAGTMLGLFGAWLAGRAMQGTLFGVPATHLPTLAVATAVLACVSLAACLIPSGRAARVSPMEALAGE